jgi:curved DNA-binding protein CbpA
MDTDDNLYQILGLEKNATTDQIKHTYRQLALKNHPDKGGDTETFKQLSHAYQILTDHELRDKYDRSLPIPETVLIPPLKVFAECFNHWLSQYPLMEFMFKDSCHNVIELLNNKNDNPVVKLLINSLIGNDLQQVGTDEMLKATEFFTAEWFQNLCHPCQPLNKIINLEKKVYVTLDDIYVGKRYPHQFMVTNEDLMLSNDYKLINAQIHINIPLEHNEINIETELHIINQKTNACYTQKICVKLAVLTIKSPNFIRIGEYDLLSDISLTVDEFVKRPILDIDYLNHKVLRFNNPKNGNLRQLYKIENIGLPNRALKKRGNLYLQFILVIHPDQPSMMVPDSGQGYVYQLLPVDKCCIYLTDDTSEDILPIYSLDKLLV